MSGKRIARNVEHSPLQDLATPAGHRRFGKCLRHGARSLLFSMLIWSMVSGELLLATTGNPPPDVPDDPPPPCTGCQCSGPGSNSGPFGGGGFGPGTPGFMGPSAGNRTSSASGSKGSEGVGGGSSFGGRVGGPGYNVVSGGTVFGGRVGPSSSCSGGRCTSSGGRFGGGRQGPITAYPVYLARGSVLESATDLSLPGPIQNWSHRREYDSLLNLTGGGEITSAAGVRWMADTRGPYLLEESGNSDIGLYLVATSKRVFAHSMGTYTAPSDYVATLVKSGSGASEIFTLTEPDTGNVYIFGGFNASVLAHNRGKLLEQTTVEYQEQGLSGIEYTYSSTSGDRSQVTTADPQGWTIDYTYYTSGSESGRLQKIEVKNGSSTVIQKVEYTYYGNVTSPSSDIGSAGDLVQIKVSRLASDRTNWTVRYTQYRYHTGTTGTRDGSTHQVKMVLESDAIERINEAGNANVDTPDEILSQDDSYTVAGGNAVEDYSNRQFTYYTSNLNTGNSITTDWGSENLSTKYGGTNLNEYDTSAYGRVKTETVTGSCATCGGSGAAGVTLTYYYMDLHGGTSTDASEVVRLVVEDATDSSGAELRRTIRGSNDNANTLREVVIEDPTQGTLTAWCGSSLINSDLRITEQRAPSAHTLVDTDAEVKKFLDPTVSTNDADTLNSSDGLITVYEYNSDDRLDGVRVKEGSSGTAYYVSATDYGNGTTTPAYLPTATYTYSSKTTTRSSGIQTTTAYTFWDSNKNQIKKQTTTLPSIASGQNGPGTSAVREQYFDKKGRLRWTKDALGYVNYFSYHPDTGGLAYRAIDVDPSSMPSSATGNDTKWDPSTQDGDGNGTYDSSGIPTRSGAISTELELVTTTEFDDQGRTTLVTDTGGAEHYTIYEDTRMLHFPYWDSTNSECLLPIGVTVLCDCGQVDERISVKGDYGSISTASSAPTGFSSDPSQSDYVAWTHYDYDDASGKLSTIDTYHDIPSSGTGTLSTNFNRTVLQYDDEGRPTYTIQTVSGTSTSAGVEQVSQRVYDLLGRVTETKLGVSDSSHDMTSSYTTYPTLRTIGKTVYDEAGVGDSLVTQSQRFHGTGANDYTGVNYKRTYRGHLRGLEPFYHNGSSETAAGPYTVVDVDWRGLTTAVGQFTSAPTWSTVLTGDGYTDYATGTSTNRGTLTETSYDDLGRVYQTKQYAINTSTGAKGSAVQANSYYDLNGQVVAGGDATGGTSQELAYDAAGRQYQTRTVLELESTKYSSGAFQYRAPTPHPTHSSMTGGDDKVITLGHSVFDSSGNVTEQHAYEMNHDDGTAGIDLSNDDDYVRQTVYSWYDDADRVKTTGEYGSGDTAAGAGEWKYAAVPTRPGTAPSASSDTVLVSEFAYDASTGRLSTMTDPAGYDTKSFYDDLGRTTWIAEHYDDFDPGTLSTISDGTDDSKDRVTKTEYDGLGNTTKQIAYNGSSSAAEETVYLFEDAVNADRVTNTIYPDSSDTTSSGSDQVKVTYNTDGTPSQRTDQRGTVIAYSYDNLRRPQSQKVTTLGGSTDGAVRSLTTKYDSLGRVSQETSHGNQTDDPDNTTDIENQVVFTYNDLGLVTKSEQAHSGAVGMSTPSVEYAYDTSAASSVFDDGPRLESLTYPSGRTLFYDYGTADALADRLSVPEKLRETNGAGTILVAYSRTGSGDPVITDYQQPDLKLDLFGGTTGTYAGLDRFGRDVDHRWYDYTSGTVDRARYYYGYDHNSNRNWQKDPVASANSSNLDILYAYDGLNRLTAYDRGDINSGHTAITTLAFAQDWDLDQLNNWSAFDEDDDGDATNELEQDRTHNDANEITAITATTGANWVDPTYDAAGNMITGPTPGDETSTQKYVYDAWNRLVEVTDGSDVTQATFDYDARNHRVTKGIYVSGSLDHTRHYYHTEQNQVVEERIDSSTDPDRQYTWGDRYVDDLVLRTRDTDSNGSLDETVYALHDSNWSITALADTSGAVVERFRYDAYGRAVVLDADFSADGDGTSDYEWEYRFTSREWDAEDGLYSFRSRVYDAGIARFLSRDPIDYLDGLNLYAAYFAPDLVDPYGDTAIDWRKCNSYWADVRKKMKSLIDKMKKKGCKIPKFECGRCGNKKQPPVKYYPGRIRVCVESADGKYTVETLKMAIQHELIHAFDDCFGYSLKSCNEVACSEIRAYSQNCVKGSPWRGRLTYEECVKKYATASLALWARATNADCKGKEKDLVDKLYDQCKLKPGCTDADAPPTFD